MCSAFATYWASALPRDCGISRIGRLYLFPGAIEPPILAPLVDGFVDADHIAANWSEVLRLATSVRSGAVQASAMLKKLSGYPRQNGLAVALRDIGRIERSHFMLGWYCDPELRRRTGLGLNKGEARNTLARAIFFNRLGERRDRSAARRPDYHQNRRAVERPAGAANPCAVAPEPCVPCIRDRQLSVARHRNDGGGAHRDDHDRQGQLPGSLVTSSTSDASVAKRPSTS